MTNKYIVIYTDGSCFYKSQLGGIGIVLEYYSNKRLEKSKEISKGYFKTTISRMELRAVCKALESIKNKKIPIYLISDSEYVIKSVNERRVFRWNRINFDGIKNSDLWMRFLNIYEQFDSKQLHFIHNKGHNKGREIFKEGNNKADKLANYKNFEMYKEDV